MRQVPNRTKLRRTYLRRKAETYMTLLTSSGLVVVFVLILAAIIALARWFVLQQQPGMAIVMVGFGFFPLFLCLVCLNDVKNTKQKSRRLPYVPPVTPETLPADEILVRGAQPPPVVQNEVLLRAATAASTPKEELVRGAEE